MRRERREQETSKIIEKTGREVTEDNVDVVRVKRAQRLGRSPLRCSDRATRYVMVLPLLRLIDEACAFGADKYRLIDISSGPFLVLATLSELPGMIPAPDSPAPSGSQANGTAPSAPGSKSQKSMTKAERRELQEKQRAEKAAKAAEATTSGGGKGGGKQPAASGSSAPKKPTRGGADASTSQLAPNRVVKDLKEAAATNEDLARRTHGLRIFSHFGLTKAVSGKGDIHPVIVRLALQFSEFKISGANARCIATLTAFKTVGLHTILVLCLCLTSFTPGYSRLCDTTKQHTLATPHDISFPANLTSSLRSTHVGDYG